MFFLGIQILRYFSQYFIAVKRCQGQGNSFRKDNISWGIAYFRSLAHYHYGMEAYGNKVLVNELIILYLDTQAAGKEQDTEPELSI